MSARIGYPHGCVASPTAYGRLLAAVFSSGRR